MLRVATFNVLFGHRRQGPGSWGERLPLLKRAIGATRADVLGLQEVLPSTLDDVARLVEPLALVAGPTSGPPRWIDVSRSVDAIAHALHASRRAPGGGSGPGSERMVAGEHLPIAYRRDRFDLRSSGGFWISSTPDVPGSMLPLAPTPFLVHWARLASHDGARELLILNAHFGHAPWHHAATSRVVMERLVALQDGEAEVFLVGDFNATTSSRLLRTLTSPGVGLVNGSREVAVRHGPRSTFHWGLGATRLGLTLDYVLARTTLRAHRAEIVDVHDGRLHASDHRPLVVTFGQA